VRWFPVKPAVFGWCHKRTLPAIPARVFASRNLKEIFAFPPLPFSPRPFTFSSCFLPVLRMGFGPRDGQKTLCCRTVPLKKPPMSLFFPPCPHGVKPHDTFPRFFFRPAFLTHRGFARPCGRHFHLYRSFMRLARPLPFVTMQSFLHNAK